MDKHEIERCGDIEFGEIASKRRNGQRPSLGRPTTQFEWRFADIQDTDFDLVTGSRPGDER
ncbi:MAG TPA: hypothetical protein VFN27_13305 [Xanthobacteraceae bacterium]|nr:hypothetical protein [Xanthobacteraceae bacterium]